MVYKLVQTASKRWRRLNGSSQFGHLMQGKKFVRQWTLAGRRLTRLSPQPQEY
jgi:hypothetical protein